VSSYSAAAVSPCAPDQTGDKELQRLHVEETVLPLTTCTTKTAVVVEYMFSICMMVVSCLASLSARRAMGEFPTLYVLIY